MSQPVYRFGIFTVDTGAHALFKSGTRLPLQEQPFQVLLALLENPGQVVTRETLRVRLWGTDTFVDFDQSLNSALRRLRLALEDNSREPTFVDTIPRVGFRFLPEVWVESSVSTILTHEEEPPSGVLEARVPAMAPSPMPDGNRRRFASIAGSVAAVMFLLGILMGVVPSLWTAPDSAGSINRDRDLSDTGFPSLSGVAWAADSVVHKGSVTFPLSGASMSELEGWFHLKQRTQADYVQATAAFDRALAADPYNVSALVGLGQTEILMSLNGDAPATRLQHARSLGQKALLLSPHLASAHTVIGAADALLDWNDDEAEQEFRTALHLDTQNSLAHLWYSVFVLLPRQEYRDAESEALVAVKEDPLSLIAHTDLGWILDSAGKHQAAMEEYRFVLQLNPNFVPAQFRMRQLAVAENRAGKSGQASLAFASQPVTLASKAGDPSAVCTQAETALHTTGPATISALRTGVEHRCSDLYFFAQNPELATLHEDPAYRALLHEAHPRLAE